MKKRVLICIAVLLLLPAVFSCAEETAECGVDLNGNGVPVDIFTGAKLTVVNVWGTFCGPCIREMPDLGKLAAEYADSGVRFVGIVCDVSEETGPIDRAVSIVETTQANYTHLLINRELYFRFASQSDYIPMTWLLDEKGEPLAAEPLIGSRSYEEWKEIIEGCLMRE